MDEWRRGWTERERKNKNSDREGREASPVRGLRASWKRSFGLGPSAVVELSCSFICFRLCDSRQKSDHCCSAWLAVAHTHKVRTYTQLTGLRPSHTRLTPSLISQFELFSCCLEATTTARSIKQTEFVHFSVLRMMFAHLRPLFYKFLKPALILMTSITAVFTDVAGPILNTFLHKSSEDTGLMCTKVNIFHDSETSHGLKLKILIFPF